MVSSDGVVAVATADAVAAAVAVAAMDATVGQTGQWPRVIRTFLDRRSWRRM